MSQITITLTPTLEVDAPEVMDQPTIVLLLPYLAAAGPGGGVTDHGALTGLADDDHTQYLNNARGDARYQPLDSDLTAIAALSTTAYGRALLALADAAAGRTALGLPDGTEWPARAVVGNGNRFPAYYQTDPNTVFNQARRRKVSAAAGFRDIKLTYCGFSMYGGGEAAITAAFTLRAAILYKGTIYPVTFGGARDKTFSAGKSWVESDAVAGLTLPAGSTFIELTRTVSTTGGDSVLVTGEWDAAFEEWCYAGTSTAIDYTAGGWPGGLSPAAGYFVVSGGGTITSLVTTAGGSNYTAAYLPVYAFDPDAGLHAATLIANIGCTAGVGTVGTTSGGALVNTTGWGPNTRPVYADASVYVQRRAYHAALITGAPDRPTSSLLVIGDSNDSGYTSSDGIGDEARNFGLYERAVSSRVGVAHLSFSGAFASALVTESALPICHAILDPLAANGNLKVLWQACGNDIGGSIAAGVVMGSMRAGAALWRGRGAQVSFVTPVPRTTSTDSWVTAANQTPATGFAAGKTGALDDVTDAVRWQRNGLLSDFGVCDARVAAEDAATPNVWRSDGGAVTADGSHTSAARGLRFVASSIVLPDLT